MAIAHLLICFSDAVSFRMEDSNLNQADPGGGDVAQFLRMLCVQNQLLQASQRTQIFFRLAKQTAEKLFKIPPVNYS
ncbi:hypothetical protein NX773_19225 [Massilia solisilvae]|uniref:Uncharacterized protein n=1 Tax=Massilia solisilvae TaxID=1811225 RepID=A0ABT2BP83_9BURK|nr:hypothetical protein [Massilia solisilvae]MCS0610304.1 hypothetical protein [Massilia solisilvae]